KPSPSKATAVAAPEPPPALAAGTAVELGKARPGDVISIQGAAEDFSDLDFTVDRRSAYQSGPRRWVDLSGEFRGRRVYLEVHSGSEPEVMGLLDGRRLTLPDVGATEDQMTEMDARQDPSAFLTYEGHRWYFESSREIGYFENETGEGEGLYRWLFREKDGSRLLCIEKWEGQPFDVRLARRLKVEDITVYTAA
ncbi:MAG TPA: DUF4178 domain-containing protein, partial [Bryobacteraceae bacterium]|nr:DUF4178 domain-containing protein [Bryobacteraceae bacterium]